MVGDVSGKRVPAALFMMVANLMIADRTMMGGTPAEILTYVNQNLSTHNKAQMFVTVWLGMLELLPGSKIFIYTDGVPEAENAEEAMFGTERMLAALNEVPDKAPEQILVSVRHAVDSFVQDAEQFDDLTMLCLEYKGKIPERT